MSVLTSTAMLVAPSAANAVSITTSGTAWNNSGWSEFIASTADVTSIAGVTSSDGTTGTSEVEIEFGVGTAGNEVGVGVWRVYFGSTGGFPGSQHLQAPYPLGGIGSGVRVAIRVRKSVSSVTTVKLKIAHYTSLSSDQQTTSTQLYSAAPAAANGAAITASTTAFANSAYAELTSGLASGSGFYGLAPNYPNTDVDVEFDIATGGSGAEVVKTTLRTAVTASGPFGGMLAVLMVAAYSIPVSTRVAVRVRKSGTAAGAYTAAGVYITDVSPVTGSPWLTYAQMRG